jgi:hypothetical protein
MNSFEDKMGVSDKNMLKAEEVTRRKGRTA